MTSSWGMSQGSKINLPSLQVRDALQRVPITSWDMQQPLQ